MSHQIQLWIILLQFVCNHQNNVVNKSHEHVDLNRAPPAGEAGPSRFQLTLAAHPQTLSQILNVMHISVPPAATSPPPAHISSASTSVFPFPCTRGGGR